MRKPITPGPALLGQEVCPAAPRSCENHRASTRGDPKHLDLFTLTCFNLSHLPSTLHLMQYTYRDFFPWLETVPELGFRCLSGLLPFFISSLPCGQNVSLFSSRETKKRHLGQDRVHREGGAQGSCCFRSKTAEHSAQCGQVHS